jgi:hypothetical protein
MVNLYPLPAKDPPNRSTPPKKRQPKPHPPIKGILRWSSFQNGITAELKTLYCIMIALNARSGLLLDFFGITSIRTIPKKHEAQS